MPDTDEIAFLRKQDLLEDFTDEELHAVHRLLHKKNIPYNSYIVEEGEISTDLYFIAQGEVSILKWDEDHQHQLPLGRLQDGEMFGEMAFMDAEPRAASIKTVKDTEVWMLSRDDVDTHLRHFPNAVQKLLVNIAKMNINRLRNSNVSYTANLRAGLRKLQVRIDVGEFILALILMLLGTRLLEVWIKGQLIVPYPGLDWVFWGLAIIPTVLLVKAFHLYSDEIGLAFSNWQATLKTSLWIIVAGISLIWLFDAIYASVNWELFKTVFVPPNIPRNILMLSATYFIYCCIVEFIARGAILSSFQRFLNDDSWKPIVYSALLLGLLEAPFSLRMGVSTFLASLFLGKIYLLQNSLLGVVLIHFCLGLFILYLGL